MTASAQSAAVLTELAGGTLQGQWTLDRSASSVTLKTASMWGMAKIAATFSDVSGDATVVDGTVSSARVVVGAASIDTKNAKRDKHLRSADFLDTQKYPDIVFSLNSITAGPSGLSANGNLTVAATTKPITVDVDASRTGDSLITLSAHLDIDRSDYGLGWNKVGMASMLNTLALSLVFTRS